MSIQANNDANSWGEEKSARTKEQEKMRKDLYLGEVHDVGLADSITSFLDHEVASHPELEPRFVQILEASAVRLRWLHERLRVFEGGLGMEEVPASRVEDILQVFKDQNKTLTEMLPICHPEHGREPAPYHDVNVNSTPTRMVNKDWIEWYCNVWGVSKVQAMGRVVRRTMEMLFPTEQSRIGLRGWVNDTDKPKELDGVTHFPNEIVLERQVSHRV